MYVCNQRTIRLFSVFLLFQSPRGEIYSHHRHSICSRLAFCYLRPVFIIFFSNLRSDNHNIVLYSSIYTATATPHQPWANRGAFGSISSKKRDNNNCLKCISLAEEADRRLFKSINQCQTHVLRHLFIDNPTSTRSLRLRAHNFILPLKDNRNFVSRVLYEAICPPPDCA